MPGKALHMGKGEGSTQTLVNNLKVNFVDYQDDNRLGFNESLVYSCHAGYTRSLPQLYTILHWSKNL